MREAGIEPFRLSKGSFSQMYWAIAQMLTHHASNGCNLRPGDLMASGTVSGPEPGMQGCLLEITQRGANPIELPTGETRSFLADGDEIILHGYCEKAGYARVGFGECRGIVLPVAQPPYSLEIGTGQNY
jgi:fumarylacetoacetase